MLARPCSNVVLDFHRYEQAPYFKLMTGYLAHRQVAVPDYELQYRELLDYFTTTKTLHKYNRFQVSPVV